jgi:hypothetical protein
VFNKTSTRWPIPSYFTIPTWPGRLKNGAKKNAAGLRIAQDLGPEELIKKCMSLN